MKYHVQKFAVGLFMLFLTIPLFGQESNNETKEPWEVTLAPYVLFGSLNGETTIGVTGPSEVNADFGDLLESLKFAFMAHGEVHKGKWGLIADFIYMKLGDDLDTPTGGILSATVIESILETFINHRIKKEWGWIDLYAGTRWWDIDLDLEIDGILSAESARDESWIDPVVGGRVFYDSPKGLIAGLRFDVGGFGLNSDFSYTIQPGVGYRFSDLFTIMLQYKYLDNDYENGEEGREFFALDAATHGPLLGFVLQF